MHIAYKYVHDDEMKSQAATPDMAVALKKDINIDHSKNYANVIAQRPFNTRRNSLNKDSFIKKNVFADFSRQKTRASSAL